MDTVLNLKSSGANLSSSDCASPRTQNGFRAWGRPLLIVDDSAIHRTICARMVKSLGLSFETAEDGAEALTKMLDQKREYSCVLSDIQMPNMDGPSAARALRSHNNLTPIVAMSTALEEEGNALDAGCDLFLPKPVSRDTLKSSLLAILAKTQQAAAQAARNGGLPGADSPRRHSVGDLPRPGSRPILTDLDPSTAAEDYLAPPPSSSSSYGAPLPLGAPAAASLAPIATSALPVQGGAPTGPLHPLSSRTAPGSPLFHGPGYFDRTADAPHPSTQAPLPSVGPAPLPVASWATLPLPLPAPNPPLPGAPSLGTIAPGRMARVGSFRGQAEEGNGGGTASLPPGPPPSLPITGRVPGSPLRQGAALKQGNPSTRGGPMEGDRGPSGLMQSA